MKRKFLVIILLITIYALPVHGEGDGPVQVIWSDDQEVILELVVPGFQVQDVNHDGVPYQQVSIPGFGLTTEIGHPQLPVRGLAIGVPEGNKPVLEVLASDFKIFPNYKIAPVPQTEVNEKEGMVVGQFFTFVEDEVIYSQDAFYPPKFARMGFTGKMRDQYVVQVVLFPLQFNPVRQELLLYNRILLRIGFNDAGGGDGEDVSDLEKPQVLKKARATGSVVKQAPYEIMLKGFLLNYNEVRGR